MASGAIIITWGQPVRGQEREVMREFNQGFGHHVARAGQSGSGITSVRTYLFSTGNLSEHTGMMIIEGDRDAVHKLQLEQSFIESLGRVSRIVENVNSRAAVGGSPSDLAEPLAAYEALVR